MELAEITTSWYHSVVPKFWYFFTVFVSPFLYFGTTAKIPELRFVQIVVGLWISDNEDNPTCQQAYD